MNKFGHIGATLLILSPFVKQIGAKFVIVATFFSLAPDIDLALKIKHRQYTHNVTFAALLTLASYFALVKLNLNPILCLAAFVGVCIHIIVDLFTMYKFPPLYPFSKKKYGFRLVKSDDSYINNTIFVLGILFTAYFMR